MAKKKLNTENIIAGKENAVSVPIVKKFSLEDLKEKHNSMGTEMFLKYLSINEYKTNSKGLLFIRNVKSGKDLK